MDVFHVDHHQITAFGVTAAAAAIVLTFATVAILRSRPHLAVRPSMQLAVLHIAFFMWPMVIFSSNLSAWLPDPYVLVMALSSFVLAILMWNLVALGGAAEAAWSRISGSTASTRSLVFASIALAIISLVIMLSYFRTVPLTQTGLVVALLNPEGATIAREESLKLLDNQITKYSFSIFASSIGPMLGVILLSLFARALFRRHFLIGILPLAAFFLVIVALSITGARSFAVSTLAAALLAALFRRGFRIRLSLLVLGMLICMLPAIVITVLREGQGIEAAAFVTQLTSVLGNRLFVSPLEVGASYVHFAQTHGTIGIAAIPKLAMLWDGSEGLNVPNHIGLSYFGGTALSVSANAGFSLSYVAYFGALGVLVATFCAISLDFVILIYRWISTDLLVPCVAVLGSAMLALLSVDFTVVLITYGFLVAPIVALSLSVFGHAWSRRDAGKSGTT